MRSQTIASTNHQPWKMTLGVILTSGHQVSFGLEVLPRHWGAETHSSNLAWSKLLAQRICKHNNIVVLPRSSGHQFFELIAEWEGGTGYEKIRGRTFQRQKSVWKVMQWKCICSMWRRVGRPRVAEANNESGRRQHQRGRWGGIRSCLMGLLGEGASLGESDGDNFQDYLSLLADWLLKRASMP